MAKEPKAGKPKPTARRKDDAAKEPGRDDHVHFGVDFEDAARALIAPKVGGKRLDYATLTHRAA